MNDPKSQSQQPANDAGPTPDVEAPDIEDSFATGTNQDPEGPSSAAPQPETVEQAGEAALAKRIDELQSEMANQRDQLLRAVAEAENGRRRAEREKEDTAKFAISKFARDMLDISDNLRRALDTTEGETLAPILQENEGVKVFVDGVAATERALVQAFEKHGLVKLTPMDEKFDPNFHQAMIEVPTDDSPPGTVVQVMQPGYVLNGRLIRPALVGVAKGTIPKKVDTTA